MYEATLNDALRGICVLDFAQIGAGPTCGMLLGDLGAAVYKIEPPSGDMRPPHIRQIAYTIAFEDLQAHCEKLIGASARGRAVVKFS